MELINVCEVKAIISGVTYTEIVNDDTDSINEALKNMGIENKTNSDPSSDIKFLKKMRKKYKDLEDLEIQKFSQDISTSELYVVIKVEDYNVRNVLKDIRQKEKRSHKKF